MTAASDETIKAAMAVGRDVAEGRIDPADLEGELAAACRSLFGTVVGPDDPLFALQIDVARGVLAAGGLPADEIGEWLAVAKRRDDETTGLSQN